MFRTLLIFSLLILSSCYYRHVRVAEDITPGNIVGEKLDGRYGSTDIRIQTTKVLGSLLDRWAVKTSWNPGCPKMRFIITDIDNRTDCYISTDMIRDIFEGASVNDGRFIVVVGDKSNEAELDALMSKITKDPRYAPDETVQPMLATIAASQGTGANACGAASQTQVVMNVYDKPVDAAPTESKYGGCRPAVGQATAPQFLAKVRITKASVEQPCYTLQDYRMTVTLYDIQTQEVVDSAWDVLSKKVYR